MNFKAFLIKWIMILAVLWVVLGWFFDVSFTDVLITSVVLTVIAYAADKFILPRVGNVFAALSDFVLVMAIIWLLGSMLYEGPLALGTAAFISAIIITIGELIFHRTMKDQIVDTVPDRERDNAQFRPSNLQTEFGSEIDVDSVKKGKEEGTIHFNQANRKTEFGKELNIGTAKKATDNGSRAYIQPTNRKTEFGKEIDFEAVKKAKNQNQPSARNNKKKKHK